jgi:hypothetical protein
VADEANYEQYLVKIGVASAVCHLCLAKFKRDFPIGVRRAPPFWGAFSYDSAGMYLGISDPSDRSILNPCSE